MNADALGLGKVKVDVMSTTTVSHSEVKNIVYDKAGVNLSYDATTTLVNSAADVFSETVSKLATVCSNLFCNAPKAERCSETLLIAFWNGPDQQDLLLLVKYG